MAALTLESKKIKYVSFHFYPPICHEVLRPDARSLVFWMLSFKSAFSLFSFTFIKRLFSSSSFSAIRVVSSAYLKLLIFLLALSILAYDTSSPSFLMMYSARKLNKQGDNIHPCFTPFPNLEPVCCSMSGSSRCFLTAYRFLRKQVRWSGIPCL